jgi:hypothetical protein
MIGLAVLSAIPHLPFLLGHFVLRDHHGNVLERRGQQLKPLMRCRRVAEAEVERTSLDAGPAHDLGGYFGGRRAATRLIVLAIISGRFATHKITHKLIESFDRQPVLATKKKKGEGKEESG